jgi:predicted nucleic acid-binding protein
MSGKNNRTKYSWDTNLFIAHLKREVDKPLADIAAIANEVELGRADFVISTIVIAELLDVIDDPVLATDFQGFIRRPNVLVVSVDPRIARRTAQLRAEWRAMAAPDDTPRNIKTPTLS